ncbi:MAG: DUF4132 domain-containing protein [Micrococcales bacterium]|nr:DUF4132 domain-containing protein [Micrococcales bacterium]MCL2668506.1 DUF4132 domain-containing protein [Micrococcales bacterium]
MTSPSPYEFVFPQRFVKDVLPRPGGVEVPQPPFAKDAADQWWKRLYAVCDKVNELLASDQTDPDLAAAAADESSPAWAAMALHLGTWGDPQGKLQGKRDPAQSWADSAVAAIGAVAAAQVAVWWAGTGVLVEKLEDYAGIWKPVSTYTTPWAPPGTRRAGRSSERLAGFVRRDEHNTDDASVGGYWTWEYSIVSFHDVRLRLRLAASRWEGVEEALEPLAALGGGARLVMSALVPQRRDWYLAADRGRFVDLLISAQNVDELMAFTQLHHDDWGWARPHPAWPTALDAVGTDLAEVVEAAVESGAVDVANEYSLPPTLPTDVLSEIPTSTAFRVLLKAADVNRDAAAAAVGHALRWPRVAAPVLAASAAANSRSRTLLGMISLVDLAEHRDEFSAEDWAIIETHAKGPDGPVAQISAVPGALASLPKGRKAAVPPWVAVKALPQVQLSNGAGALPETAVRNLVTMLVKSSLKKPHADVTVVRSECTGRSSAAFAWGLFEQWQLAGYPASGGWVLDALGVLGDDDTARRLAPLVRVWPGESAHGRAVKGLDVLLAIGSDVALMQLYSISQKVKFKGIKGQAQKRIDALADRLGLEPAQLEDRLVPDLGLAPDGTMVLDFGDKTFTVGFDEQLRPTVVDAQGKVRKTLPKTTTEPGVSSAKTFAALKKDVRALADLQLRRLEGAMATQRGWTLAEFTTYLVDHPLVWHLTRRLVWQADNGFFRVAEDKTFADVDDETRRSPCTALSAWLTS